MQTSQLIKVSFNPDISPKAEWVNEFIQSISKMDIELLERLLDDDHVYNDQSKWDFLAHIRDVFGYNKQDGASELLMRMEKCQVCKYGCPVHYFYSNEIKRWMAFRLDFKGEQLTDIVICNMPTDL